VIIGVHTPEFAFEHVPSNVAAQSAALGVRYPVAIDNDYGTWNAYGNQYWPAEYLVDPSGVIRHVSFGEGEYAGTEELIRQLLVEHDPAPQLPPSADTAAVVGGAHGRLPAGIPVGAALIAAMLTLALSNPPRGRAARRRPAELTMPEPQPPQA
jgi:hypothetical protein